MLQYTLEFIEYQVDFIVKTPDNIELPFQIVSDSLGIYYYRAFIVIGQLWLTLNNYRVEILRFYTQISPKFI